jgi:hypothetical protein
VAYSLEALRKDTSYVYLFWRGAYLNTFIVTFTFLFQFLLSRISFRSLQIFCDWGKDDNALKSVRIIYEVDLACTCSLGDMAMCVFSDSRIRIVC